MKRIIRRNPTLDEARARQNAEGDRMLLEGCVRDQERRLRECLKPGCLKCMDAKVMLRHYKGRLKKAIAAEAASMGA